MNRLRYKSFIYKVSRIKYKRICSLPWCREYLIQKATNIHLKSKKKKKKDKLGLVKI